MDTLEKAETAKLHVEDLTIVTNPRNKLILTISGQQFVTTFSTLLKYPETKLGKLASLQPTVIKHYFEADIDIFKEIIKFYRTDKLHCPKNVCFSDFCEHLEFWEIDVTRISDCCSRHLKEELQLDRQFAYFERGIRLQKDDLGSCKVTRHLIWLFLTEPSGTDTKFKLGSKVWAVFYLLVTFFSGITLAIQTLPFEWVELPNNTFFFNGTINENGNWSKCDEMDVYMSTPAYIQLRWINLIVVIFYIIEIWIRFCCCIDKIFFCKSLNGLDMIISVLESTGYVYTTYVAHTMMIFFDYPDRDYHCSIALRTDIILTVIGQLRFIRLFSYATVYR